MNRQVDVKAIEHRLKRISRAGEGKGSEVSVVTSPGDKVPVWVVKVKGNIVYNKYSVKRVVLTGEGSEPLETGSQTEAFNLAEAFDQQGQLQAGSYVMMAKAGEYYVFRAEI